MKAAYYSQFGPSNVLEIGEKSISAPSTGEVQVQVHASGINPSDVKKRAGARGKMSDDYVIPHSDGAGIIIAAGSGVDGAWVGKRVWICEAQHGRPHGTAAECVNLPLAMIHSLPDNTSYLEGAAIGIPMMTAHRCLTSAGTVDGKTVLVTGANGRVGHYAVQMAAEMGARVIATVGSDAELPAIKAIGASYAANFRAPDYIEAIAANIGNASIDVVVDVEFGQNLARYLPLMKDNSVVASYASGAQPNPTIAFYDLMFRNIFVHPILVYSMPESAKHAAKIAINQMLEKDVISHRISNVLPLEKIAEAHELIENGQKGAVILETGC